MAPDCLANARDVQVTPMPPALTATVRVRYRWPFRVWYAVAAFCAHRGWVDATGWCAERAMRHVELYTMDGHKLRHTVSDHGEHRDS